MLSPHPWVIVNTIITMLIMAANTYPGAIIPAVSPLSGSNLKGSLVSHALFQFHPTA
jgi:hypothetical protein